MAKVIIEQAGGTFHVGDNKRFTIHDNLPVGVYQTVQNPFTGEIYMVQTDDFVIQTKLYGSIGARAKRCMAAFNSRDRSTGVLLSGDKGAGKTLLAKRIAELALQQGVPVIISSPSVVRASNYVDFINDLKFPLINILDEFEKMFENNDEQNSLLTLFDGVMTSAKRMFILTVNEPRKVNDFFHSRPGRILYKFNYRGVEEEAAEEFMMDNKVPASFFNDFKIYHKMNQKLSFDSLAAIIEEFTRFGGTFKETIDGLNISDYDAFSWKTYDVSIYNKEKNITVPASFNTRINDLSSFRFHISDHFKCKLDDEKDETDEVADDYKVHDHSNYAKEVNKLPLEHRKFVHDNYVEKVYESKGDNFVKMDDDIGMVYWEPDHKVFIIIKEYIPPQVDMGKWD